MHICNKTRHFKSRKMNTYEKTGGGSSSRRLLPQPSLCNSVGLWVFWVKSRFFARLPSNSFPFTSLSRPRDPTLVISHLCKKPGGEAPLNQLFVLSLGGSTCCACSQSINRAGQVSTGRPRFFMPNPCPPRE